MTGVVAGNSKKGASSLTATRGLPLKTVSQETLVFGTTAVIFVLCSIFIGGFFTLANISTLTRSVSVLGILGVGMTVVVIGRGLDLSQIAVMAITAAWTLKLIGAGYSSPSALRWAPRSRSRSASSTAS